MLILQQNSAIATSQKLRGREREGGGRERIVMVLTGFLIGRKRRWKRWERNEIEQGKKNRIGPWSKTLFFQKRG